MSWIGVIKFVSFIFKSFQWTASVESTFMLTTVRQVQPTQWNLQIQILSYSLFINLLGIAPFITHKQNTQYTYNVTLRRVRVTIVVVEKQWVLHNPSVCICSLSYSGCNAHAPYCHLWSAPLYNISTHCRINGRIFGKKSYWAKNMCFDFVYNFWPKHSSF
jgi:hypothetical protein